MLNLIKNHPLISLYIASSLSMSIGFAIEKELFNVFLVSFGALMAMLVIILAIVDKEKGNS